MTPRARKRPCFHPLALGIADLHPRRVEDRDRIHPVQRSALPFPHLIQHGIRDAADQVGRDLRAVEIEQMRLDKTRRAPGPVAGLEMRLDRGDELGMRALTGVRQAITPCVEANREMFCALDSQLLGQVWWRLAMRANLMWPPARKKPPLSSGCQ